MQRLQERVLSVEKFGASHQSVIFVEVLYHLLKEFDLTQKVSIYIFVIINPRWMNFF